MSKVVVRNSTSVKRVEDLEIGELVILTIDEEPRTCIFLQSMDMQEQFLFAVLRGPDGSSYSTECVWDGTDVLSFGVNWVFETDATELTMLGTQREVAAVPGDFIQSSHQEGILFHHGGPVNGGRVVFDPKTMKGNGSFPSKLASKFAWRIWASEEDRKMKKKPVHSFAPIPVLEKA